MKLIDNVVELIEKRIYGSYYFPFPNTVSIEHRVRLLVKFLLLFIFRVYSKDSNEIVFFIQSAADIRMLGPILNQITTRYYSSNRVSVSVILKCDVSSNFSEMLERGNVKIYRDYTELIISSAWTRLRMVVTCLNFRDYYDSAFTHLHRVGVDLCQKLATWGIHVITLQHGGSRQDSMRAFASAEADVLLVWGEHAQKELTEKYGISRDRVKLVGNPLHDSIKGQSKDEAFHSLVEAYPELLGKAKSKKLLLLATCLHTEYSNYENESELYNLFLDRVYEAIDCNMMHLVIKEHPSDYKASLYKKRLPDDLGPHTTIIDAYESKLDVYTLITASDLVITRASTVAEEALLLRTPVITYDLFSDGIARGYDHLKDYEGYYTACPINPAMPDNTLRTTIWKALKEIPLQTVNTERVIRQFAFQLDGMSTRRVTDELERILEHKIK